MDDAIRFIIGNSNLSFYYLKLEGVVQKSCPELPPHHTVSPTVKGSESAQVWPASLWSLSKTDPSVLKCSVFLTACMYKGINVQKSVKCIEIQCLQTGIFLLHKITRKRAEFTKSMDVYPNVKKFRTHRHRHSDISESTITYNPQASPDCKPSLLTNTTTGLRLKFKQSWCETACFVSVNLMTI